MLSFGQLGGGPHPPKLMILVLVLAILDRPFKDMG
jgi:hypothetical protein